MKFLLSELGQCMIYGILFLFLIIGFYEILKGITG